jgi:hypothetical protein
MASPDVAPIDAAMFDGEGDVTDATLDGAETAARESTLVARFEPEPVMGATVPAPGMVPFPSNVYLEADGTVLDALPNFRALRMPQRNEVLTDGFRDLDGFGRNAGAMFVIDGVAPLDGDPLPEVDSATLPQDAVSALAPDATALIFDLDPSVPSSMARVPAVAGWHRLFRTITVMPDGVALKPGRTYAFVLTTGVRASGAGSVALRASPAFVALRDGGAAARQTNAGRVYGPAIDRALALLGAGFDRTRLAALTVITTQTRHRQLRSAADAIRAGRVRPAPTLVTDAMTARPYTVVRFGRSAHPGWTATLEAWLGTPRLAMDGSHLPGEPTAEVEGASVGLAHDAIGAVMTAVFEAPDFRGADGRIAYAADGTPRATRADQRIPVTLVLPRGPVPAGGFPVVQWGHGLGNHRKSILVLANELARRGIATVAIDHITFGQRAYPTDTTTIFNGTYRGPDGIGDRPDYPPGEFFGNLESMVAFRDNLRQAALDQVQLRRLVTNPALDLSWVAAEYGGVAPTLDRTRVGYAGDSLGGIIGTLYSSVEPDVNPVLLNVPGGAFFTAVGADAPTLNGLLNLISGVFGSPRAPMDRFNPLANVLQAVVDGADPASLAAEITAPPSGRPHDVWVVASLWDEIISNRSTALLAREMGLPQLAPALVSAAGLTVLDGPVRANLREGATGAFSQLSPSTHGANIASRYGVRTFATPFPREGEADRFPRAVAPFRIRQPIVGYQRAIGEYFASAFAGRTTISLGSLTVLDDTDDDGFTASEERAASTSDNDPSSHPPGPRAHSRDVGF